MKKISIVVLLAGCLLVGTRSGQAQAIVGLQASGTGLSSYTNPAGSPTSYTITGLGADTLVDIDYQLSGNGTLYGMSGTGTLYALTLSGTTYTATAASTVGAIPGGVVAIDFNPTVNRLRVFTGTATAGNNNYRITPGTSVTNNDGTLAFAGTDANAGQTPSLIGAGYTNSFLGSTSTSLYSIDLTTNSLILHSTAGTFNTLNTVATLTLGGVTFTPNANTGFDIVSSGGNNFAYLSRDNALYTVNLTSGVLTPVNTLSGGAITDIAVVPEPGTYAMLTLGGLGLVVYAVRRRQQAAA